MGFFKNLGMKKRSSKQPASSQPSTSTSDASPSSSVASTPKAKRGYVAASGPLMPSTYIRGASFDTKTEEDDDVLSLPALTDSRLQNGFSESAERHARKDDASQRLQRSLGDGGNERTTLKNSFKNLLSNNHHVEKTLPVRSASISERPAKHRKNPSLETILKNMYPGDGGRPVPEASLPDAPIAVLEAHKEGPPRASASRSGQLAPRDFTPEVETVRVTKSRSGVLSPRDWQDAASRGPRSGQLSPVDSIPEDSNTLSSKSSRAARRAGVNPRDLIQENAPSGAPVAVGGGSGTLQARDWSAAAPPAEVQVSEGILQVGRSRSGQLTPRESGYGFGLERVRQGPRSMMTSGGRDVYQGERQQKGAAQRRLNRNRHSSSDDPIPRGALMRGRLDTWQEAIAEGDENGSGTMLPNPRSGPKSAALAATYGSDLSRGATSAKARLQQSEVLFSASRNRGNAPAANAGGQTSSERMAASLAQAQKIVRGSSRSGQLAPAVSTPVALSSSARSRHDGPVDNVLARPFANVREKFQLQMEELGRGRFGVIRVCLDRKNGEKLACKSISKARLKTWEDAEDVRREIMVLELLQGHPHVVSLKGCFEDALNVHLVMEYCEGGELFDRIMAKKRYSEPEAAIVIRTIIGVLRYIHALGYIHRDLKPENVLLCHKGNDTAVKVIDFGVATSFTPGVACKEEVGTPFYLAPEVLRKSYGPEADIWSAGVVLYILLCGVPPFWANDTEGIKGAILSGKLDLLSGPWRGVSDPAKDLVRQMLRMDPEQRIKGDQILAHPWIQRLGKV